MVDTAQQSESSQQLEYLQFGGLNPIEFGSIKPKQLNLSPQGTENAEASKSNEYD